MKKIIYIFIIGFGLITVSCQKQDITPVNDNMELPTWENANSRSGEEGFTGETGEEPGEGGENGGVDITDPNKPSEGSGKGKGNS